MNAVSWLQGCPSSVGDNRASYAARVLDASEHVRGVAARGGKQAICSCRPTRNNMQVGVVVVVRGGGGGAS